jgi:hypothetical protein
MKGMVFTELLQMAEQAIGEDAVDEILDSMESETGGSYTSVGSYPCRELLQIVNGISDRSGLPCDELQRQFGSWMHNRFVESYPEFFADKKTALDMLEAIESEVHVEVRKLYPEAELPYFRTSRTDGRCLRMTYKSERPLVAFCHGLVEACVQHFGDGASIHLEQVSTQEAVFDIRLER